MLRYYNKHNIGKEGDVRNILKAIGVRIVLIIHAIITTWRAAVVRHNSYVWLIGLVNILLLLETIYITVKRKGQERKWFCPCFLLYLLGTVPSMWILKLNILQRFNDQINSGNVTIIQTEAVTTIRGTTVAFSLTAECWASLLEQTMIFLLIIGRWYLPRGELTRTQLSQLLFIFIGTGSDALEIFVVFEEAEVRSSRALCIITLVIWSISLLQFTFVLTAIKDEEKLDDQSSVFSQILATDIWSLLLTTLLHDLPYFCLRFYVLVTLHVISYGILFFTCKNFILMLAVVYRIEIFCFRKERYEEID